MADPRIPTEAQEQFALFRWAAYEAGRWPELHLLYHIPNEGKRSVVTGGRMRQEGLKKGVPDICLPVARGRYHALYIELKRTKGSKTSPEQKAWIAALRAEGCRAEICMGWDAAREVITEYLEERTGTDGNNDKV